MLGFIGIIENRMETTGIIGVILRSILFGGGPFQWGWG